jgi:uncharacterized protein (TIGR02271 family)
MDNDVAGILPGARVRAQEGLIGTVERLEASGAGSSGPPDCMIVRSEDGRWRYSLPLMLVDTVTQGPFYTIVRVAIGPDQLAPYITASVEPHEAGSAQTAPTMPSGEWLPPADDAMLRVPLAAEELIAHKRPVELGTVHVHKGVETVEQSFTVPVYREEAIIERIPPDQYDGSAPTNPNEMIIPIVEEQLVVEKRSVVKEYIRVRKNRVAEQQDVRDMVRREFVEVTQHRQDRTGVGDAPLLRETQAPHDAS